MWLINQTWAHQIREGVNVSEPNFSLHDGVRDDERIEADGDGAFACPVGAELW
jgi:hypothetical protein